MALPLGERRVAGDDGAHRLAGDDAPDIAPSGEIEHHDGELVVHAERDGGGVHDRQAPVERLDVTHPGKLHRGGILGGISGVDAVHLGSLEEDLGSDLHRAEGPRGVRGEEGIARSGGEDDHASFLQMAHGTAADVWLGHRAHLDGGQHAGGYPRLLDGVLEGEGVDHGGEHAHVVAGGAIHSPCARGNATEDVPTADDHRHLHAHGDHLADFLRDAPDRVGLDPIGLAPGQRLTGQLEQDAAIGGGPSLGHRLVRADLKAREALHDHPLAHLGGGAVDHVLDARLARGVLDERLIEEAHLRVELLQLALYDLLQDGGRLLLVGHLLDVDLALLVEHGGRYLLPRDVEGIGGSHLHGDVFHQLLKILGAGHEVRLAVDLHEDADLASG